VWSPITIGNINKIESVQRRFTKMLNGLAFVPYDERLFLLNAGKSGLDRFLLGSVAEKVVRTSKIPVLVVRGKK
jgi:nucleotide-binding universal stress UspA family protein